MTSAKDLEAAIERLGGAVTTLVSSYDIALVLAALAEAQNLADGVKSAGEDVTCSCDACLYREAYDMGRRDERASVVDWLRADENDDGGLIEADCIERGEHVTPREAEEGKGT